MEPQIYWRQQPAVQVLRWLLVGLAALFTGLTLYMTRHGGPASFPAFGVFPMLIASCMRPPLYVLADGLLSVFYPTGTEDHVPLAQATVQRLGRGGMLITWQPGEGEPVRRMPARKPRRPNKLRVGANPAFVHAVITGAAVAMSDGAAVPTHRMQMAVPPAPAWVWWAGGLLPVVIAVSIWQWQPGYMHVMAVVLSAMTLMTRERRYVLAAGELLVVTQQGIKARIPADGVTLVGRRLLQATLRTSNPAYPRVTVALLAGGAELVSTIASGR